MFNLIGNKKGITMIEVVVSVGILTIGILALLSLLPSSWRLAGHSDYLGRASGILANQIQITESMVLNPSVNLTSLMGTQALPPIKPSGQGPGVTRPGDLTFTVTRTLTSLGNNAFLITVNVAWPPVNPTGITESLRVVRQENYRQ
jgi:Tfp pilus assembly protein PilV